MKSKSLAFMLADLGITKTHSRPHVSNDNPFSEAHFKTLKYRPDFPDRFGAIQDARGHCTDFFRWYNDEHHHSALGYLKEVQRGESAAQAIDRICFSREGLLRDEFGALYSSLFQHAEQHERLVRALAAKPRGRHRNDLLDAAGLASGEGATAMLDELEAAGFVMRAPQFGREARDSLYRLADEYSLFFLRWIEGARGRRWTQQRTSAAWRAWSGYAYEGIWLSHTDRLKSALGIAGVETVESTWQAAAKGDEPGAQVDLVIDRRAGCINLCEMKFSEGEIVIDKRLASELPQGATPSSGQRGRRRRS